MSRRFSLAVRASDSLVRVDHLVWAKQTYEHPGIVSAFRAAGRWVVGEARARHGPATRQSAGARQVCRSAGTTRRQTGVAGGSMWMTGPDR